LIGGEVEQLIEVDSTIRELAEGSLLLDLEPHQHDHRHLFRLSTSLEKRRRTDYRNHG